MLLFAAPIEVTVLKFHTLSLFCVCFPKLVQLRVDLTFSLGYFHATSRKRVAEAPSLELVDLARSAFDTSALSRRKMRTSSVALLMLATILSSTAFVIVPSSTSTSIAARQIQLFAAPKDDNIFDRFSRWQMVRAL
jgi:hypothetical protein